MNTSLTTTAPPCPRAPRPGIAAFILPYLVFTAVLTVAWWHGADADFLDWYATVVWSLPVLTSITGIRGLRTMRRVLGTAHSPAHSVPVEELLVIVIPTIGRHDVVPALERVVASCRTHLPARFTRSRVDIVIEEDCPARHRILAIADRHAAVRVLGIPRDYRTPLGTRFKARANHFAHLTRLADGEARDDVWILHMDDDTAVGADTADDLARFVHTQRAAGPDGLHLAQGVLAYPRECAGSRWVWLADAVRPGCDISLFAAGTGRGSPRGGLHGELLLIRASAEAAIGWDFGPDVTVEDAQFALRFCARFPGRSGWFAGRSYGASPATLGDFFRQRQRWVAGLLRLATTRSVPLRHRLLLGHNLAVWLCGPVQHPLTILLLALAVGDLGVAPASAAAIPLWALNTTFCYWLYWEGYRINVTSSLDAGTDRLERVRLVVLMPLFALWESIGIVLGVARFLRRGDTGFTVIPKPL